VYSLLSVTLCHFDGYDVVRPLILGKLSGDEKDNDDVVCFGRKVGHIPSEVRAHVDYTGVFLLSDSHLLSAAFPPLKRT